jgi:hypothetical protein
MAACADPARATKIIKVAISERLGYVWTFGNETFAT